jgi:hypothetical protein
MPTRTRANKSVDELHDEIDLLLAKFCAELGDLTFRQKVQHLKKIQSALRSLNVRVAVDEGLDPKIARLRLLEYMRRHVDVVIDGTELSVVSGISDYPRRLRELRVEHGYKILTGASLDPFSGIDLKPDQYLLTSIDADVGAASRLQAANRIRKLTCSVQDRILAYLKENVSKVVTTEELAYVAKNKREFGRRTRELRTERGYAVATQFSGRPDLSVGEYVLLSVDRVAEEHDRYISDAVQKAVYARDNSTCRNPKCQYQYTPASPRILELHHIEEHRKGGANSIDNLIVLCSACHDDLHANRLNVLDCL